MDRTAERRFSLVSHRLLILLAVWALPAVVSILLFQGRVSSILPDEAASIATSGGEPIHLYNALKLQLGRPLYEDPLHPPYVSTLYNWAFYRFNGWIAQQAQGDFANQTRAIRLANLVWLAGIVGIVMGYALNCRKRSQISAPLPTFGLLAIYAATAAFFGWWILTARPDFAGATLALCGLWIVLRSGSTSRPWIFALLAGLVFGLAWSFKQSLILVFVGCGLASVWTRQWKIMMGLGAGFLTVVVPTFVLMDEHYRTNVLKAATFSPMQIKNLIALLDDLCLKSFLMTVSAIVALVSLKRIEWLQPTEKAALTFSFLTTLGGGLVASCRYGSALNYFFEFWMVCALLAVVATLYLSNKSSTWTLVVVMLASLSVTGIDALRWFRPDWVGKATLMASPETLKERDWVRKEFARTNIEEGWVYCETPMWGMDVKFPAGEETWEKILWIIPEDFEYFQKPAFRKGVISEPLIEGMIAKKQLRLLFLRSDHQELIDIARKAGYQQGGVALETSPSLTVWGLP